jgi:hypothetical protein
LFNEPSHAPATNCRSLSREPSQLISIPSREIVAGMTAAYLWGITRIENRTVDNSAPSIAGWLSKWRARHLRNNQQETERRPTYFNCDFRLFFGSGEGFP